MHEPDTLMNMRIPALQIEPYTAAVAARPYSGLPLTQMSRRRTRLPAGSL